MSIRGLIEWFAGGPDRYMTLAHCMNHDYLWIGITVALDLSVAMGYVLIALHWWRNERALKDSPAKVALGTMKTIFVFCGLCGYLFIPIKMFYPAWRLYDVFLVILVYYTWRYALESRHLRVVYDELVRSEQLALDLEASREEGRRKSHFLNALSHDLKTPLNGVMLQAEVAAMNLDLDDSQEIRCALEQIRTCARTSTELLNSFIELGRLDWSQDRTEFEPVHIGELLRGLAGRVRSRAESRGLGVAVEAPEGLWVRTDRVKLEKILDNLLDNALKFSDRGTVRLTAGPSAGGVEIAVVDSGRGIASEDLNRVFDDFVQVHNRERDSRKGYGLGLAIARRLADQLGGSLAVQSELGRGSRFTVHLSSAGVVEHQPQHPRPPAVGGEGRAPLGPGRPAPAPG
jgi:signal transduction histidine kinase